MTLLASRVTKIGKQRLWLTGNDLYVTIVNRTYGSKFGPIPEEKWELWFKFFGIADDPAIYRKTL